MNKIIITAAIATIGMFSVSAMAEGLTEEAHQAVEDAIAAEYKSDKESCNSSSGDVKKNCLDKAESKQRKSLAELESDDNELGKVLFNATVAKAVAEYSIAKDKCNAKDENQKDICLREASAAQINAINKAKAQLHADTAAKEAIEHSAQGTADAN